MKVVVVQLVKQLIENLYLDVKRRIRRIRVRLELNVFQGCCRKMRDITTATAIEEELGSDSLLSHLFLALIAAPIDATLFPRPAAV